MNQNNTLNKGIYKKVKAPKTVYDPSIISDEKMIQWGKEAMKNAAPIGNNVRSITGTAENGMRFQGYINAETGEITNFHPIF